MGTTARSKHVGWWAFTGAVILTAFASIGCNAHDICTMKGGEWSPDCPVWGPKCTMACCVLPAGKIAGGPVSHGGDLFVVATAHVAGAQDTNWRSDVEVHCLGDGPASLAVVLLEHDADNSVPASRDFTLGVGESLRLGDVLASEFGVDGSAALRVEPTEGRIMVTSRTYNLLSDGATFGQFIPAAGQGDAIRFGEEARLIQLSHSSDSASGARTNLGVVNATGMAIQVVADLYTADGTFLGTVTQGLEPYGYRQVNRVFAHVTGSDVADGYVVVRTTSGRGAFFAYASVVDNLTGDPVAIMAERVGRSAAPVYVVAAAHVAGAADTDWRTDLEVHNPGTSAIGITVELLERGVANPAPRSGAFILRPGESRRFADVLLTVFGVSEGAAALRVTPEGGEVVVTSRTFNLLGAGNALDLPEGATFGQFIPGVRVEDGAVHFGDEGRLIQLTHNRPATIGFRTNLVLVSASAVGIDVEVDLYGGDGSYLGRVTKPLAPFEYAQIDRVFERVTAESVADGYVVVRTTTEGGAFFSLASVVDNVTGDPVGMAAPRIASATTVGLLDDVGTLVDAGAFAGIEGAVSAAQGQGVDGLVAALVAARPDLATAAGQTVTHDYGSGYDAGGELLSGVETWDLSGLAIDPGGIRGQLVLDRSDLLVDGEPPTVVVITASVDVGVRPDGTVVGSIDVVGADALLKRTAVMNGWVEIDTAICPDYPIGGEVVLEEGGRLITVTFSPDCDGELTYVVGPPLADVWDFDYRYWDPTTPEAQQYIVSTRNAVLAHDSYDEELYAWVQGGYDDDCSGANPPGIVTYRFDFPRPLLSAYLKVDNRGRYLEDGVSGATEVRASNDGATWHVLASCDWSSGPGDVYCDFTGRLPDELVGTRELWVEVELCCRDAVGRLNPPCFLAVHSYYDTSRTPSGDGTFVLLADYNP